MPTSEALLARIRQGRQMTHAEQLRLIISLSVPGILAQLSQILMFFIDAAMVGSLGARQSAAIGLVETTTWLFGGLTAAVSMGFSVQVAHAIGANDMQRARRVLRQALVCACTTSALLMMIAIAISQPLPQWLGGQQELHREASQYCLIFGFAIPFFQLQSLSSSMLKCSGNMKTPSVLNVMMCVMDVVFNYFFIFILNLGVLGAAIGTLLATILTAIVMCWSLVVRSDMLSLKLDTGHFFCKEQHWYGFRPQGDVVRTAFKIGAPMGLQHLLMGSAQIVSTIIVAPLGMVAVAANSLAITVESICYMPGYGIAEAATTLVGQCIGAGQRIMTRAFAYKSVAAGMLTMTLMGILMWIFAPELMSVMTPVEAIRQAGAESLRIEAWAEPMFAAAIVCNGIFIGAGDTLVPAAMSLTSMWAVRLTLAAWLAPVYGLTGVWTAMACELTFRGAIFLARLSSGRWARH